jgi:ribonuclease HI
MAYNPHAMYVHCDGAMDYGAQAFGGVGIFVRFPDAVEMEDITISIGRYTGANIERMEIEALTQAMLEIRKLFQEHWYALQNIRHIIFVTDRFALADTERMSPYLIREWRSMGWKNHEGKPIKNHEYIDKLDKLRTKLNKELCARIQIEYKPRKQNKTADKLAKKGKVEGLVIHTLEKKSEKIGRRKFNGGELPYKAYKPEQELRINIFRKDPVQDQWEIWAEICTGLHQGMKLKIYADDEAAAELQRGNEYIVRLKNVYRYYLRVYDKIQKVAKETAGSVL